MWTLVDHCIDVVAAGPVEMVTRDGDWGGRFDWDCFRAALSTFHLPKNKILRQQY